MRKSVKFTVSVIATILVIAVLPSLCGAQAGWQDRDNRNAISVEAYRIALKTELLSFWSTAMFVSGRYSVGNNVVFVADIPMAHAGYEGWEYYDPYYGNRYSYPGESQWMIGNPYVGVDVKSSNGAFTGEIGFRPPIGAEDKDYAAVVGTMASLDRLGAFSPNTWSFSGMAGFRKVTQDGLAFQLRGGPAFLVPTNSNIDPELYVQYGGQFGYQDAKYSMMIGLRGLFWVTTDFNGITFGQRTMHSLEMSGHVLLGSVQPGLRVVIPLDKDQTDIFDAIYGLNVGFLID